MEKRGASPFSLFRATAQAVQRFSKLRPRISDELRSTKRFQQAAGRAGRRGRAPRGADLRPGPWPRAPDRGGDPPTARDEDHRGNQAAAARQATAASATQTGDAPAAVYSPARG